MYSTSYRLRLFFFFIVYFGPNESKRVIACRYIRRHGQRVRNCEARGKRSCYCEWIDGALVILRYYKYRYVLRVCLFVT